MAQVLFDYQQITEYNKKRYMIEELFIKQTLVLAKPDSHKGQNGRLLILGGSNLFHAAGLWSLTVASRIVDLVHFCSTPENNEIVQKAKEEFRNGIVIRREDIDAYIQEDDCILIGPGMERTEETKHFVDQLLKSYPQKQWVIDAGALQMMDISLIPKKAILTPHHQEFALLQQGDVSMTPEKFAKIHTCIVVEKGPIDVVTDGARVEEIHGGNVGMTKGGTGDVLAGLIAALSCTNDPFIAALSGSFINKRAGDDLYTTVGPFFNASDLAGQIPVTMKKLLL